MTFSKTILFVGVSAWALSACAVDHSEVSGAHEEHKHASKDHKHSADYKKPGAAVQFKTDFDGKAEVGVTQRFQLSIEDGYDSGDMNVRLVVPEGVSLFSTSETSFSMSEEGPHIIDVELQAFTEGRHYLNVLVTAHAEENQAIPASHTIGIYVGDAAQSKSYKDPQKQIPTSSDGVIEMEAVETIETEK